MTHKIIKTSMKGKISVSNKNLFMRINYILEQNLKLS